MTRVAVAANRFVTETHIIMINLLKVFDEYHSVRLHLAGVQAEVSARSKKLSCRREDFVIPTTGEFFERIPDSVEDQGLVIIEAADHQGGTDYYPP